MKNPRYVIAGALISGIALAAVPVFAKTASPAPTISALKAKETETNTRGTASAVNGNTVTLSTQATKTVPAATYTVDISKAKVTRLGSSKAAAISAGDTIIVTGTIQGTSITASSIIDSSGTGTLLGAKALQNGRNGTGTIGTVSAVSGNTITMTGRGTAFATKNSKADTGTITYTVAAANAKILKMGSPASASSIAVGDTIIVDGAVSGTNIAATLIQDGSGTARTGTRAAGGQPLTNGTAKSVSGSTIILLGQRGTTYTVDASQAAFTKPGSPGATMASISVGDMLAVQGTVNGTDITARMIIDKPSPKSAGGIKGVANAIGSFFSQHSMPKFPF